MRKAFINTLNDLACDNDRIFVITGDLGFSVFEDFYQKYPNQFLNIGLCEQNMIGVAAGMAMEGRHVFVYSIVPFLLYRTFEQIRNDLCYQKLNVNLIGVGSGVLYGGQGGTHHSIEDVGVMSSLPDINVFTPGDPLEVNEIIKSLIKNEGPSYIRINRNGDDIINTNNTINDFSIGAPLKICSTGYKVGIFSMGNMLPETYLLSKLLNTKSIKNSLYSVHTIKPVDINSYKNILTKFDLIITAEEHTGKNGLKTLIREICDNLGVSVKQLNFHLPDKFIHHCGSQQYYREQYNLTANQMYKKIIS